MYQEKENLYQACLQEPCVDNHQYNVVQSTPPSNAKNFHPFIKLHIKSPLCDILPFEMMTNNMTDTICVRKMAVSNYLMLFMKVFKYFIILNVYLMGVVWVILYIRMKTGFFETKAYEILVGKDRLVLSSKETGSDSIIILANNITSIILKNEKAPEIEVQTERKNYHGSFTEIIDFDKLIVVLKENLSIKIICEYEGGKDYA